MGNVAEHKARAKSERLAAAKEKDFPALFERLSTELLDKHGVSIEPFANTIKTALPAYRLVMGDKLIGFADAQVGRREEYVHVDIAIYRNGVFCVEHLGIPKTDSAELMDMRYVVFLMDWEQMHCWKYSVKTKRSYCALADGPKVNMLIPKKYWSPV